jgi:hypothetical protein
MGWDIKAADLESSNTTCRARFEARRRLLSFIAEETRERDAPRFQSFDPGPET